MLKMFTKEQKGFTLIEALVASGIFAFVISSIIGIYLATLQMDQRTKASRAVANNGRFIMDYLAKEIRNGKIDYASYPGGSADGINKDLYIINLANEEEHIYLDGTNLVLAKEAGTTNLNSDNVKVTKLEFLVLPSTDPYAASAVGRPNNQPIVTAVLELTSDSGKDVEKAIINLQSSFEARIYPSRQ